MSFKSALVGAAIALALVAPARATTYEYVGSWEVDQGPWWPTAPVAYTGQAAAALLFGGVPSDYVISTIGPNPADINFSNWVSVSTYGTTGTCNSCAEIVADNTVVSADGYYDFIGDTSAYVNAFADGSQYTNYAFLVVDPTPLPAALPLFAGGLGVMGLIVRRRKRLLAART